MKKTTLLFLLMPLSWAGFAWSASPFIGSASIVPQLKPAINQTDKGGLFAVDTTKLEAAGTAANTHVQAALQNPPAMFNAQQPQSTLAGFKQGKQRAIEENIAKLKGALAELEKDLRDASQQPPQINEALLEKLTRWAQLNAAVESEKAVLSALLSLSDNDEAARLELEAGRKEIDRVITLFQGEPTGATPQEAQARDISKDAVVADVAKFAQMQRPAHYQPLTDASSKEYSDALLKARDSLMAYYTVLVSVYKDFDHMLDGLWFIAAQSFTGRKSIEIQALAAAAVGQPVAQNADDDAAFFSAWWQIEPGRDALRAKFEARQARALQQKQVVWEEINKIANREELIAQRKIDWENAKADEVEVRTLKGVNPDLIQQAMRITNQKYEAYCKDQGRVDLEKTIQEARRALEEVLDHLRNVTSEDATDSSRRGAQVLLREGTLLRTGKYRAFFGYVGSWLGKHLSLFKEMTTVRSDFELRLRAVGRAYPGVALATPFIRVLANHYAPGLTDSWV